MRIKRRSLSVKRQLWMKNITQLNNIWIVKLFHLLVFCLNSYTASQKNNICLKIEEYI